MKELMAAVRIALVWARFAIIVAAAVAIVAYWERLTIVVDNLLRPKGQAVVDETVEYFCPMHPNVVRSEPGNCPICGMPLSRRVRGEAQVLPPGVRSRQQFAPFRIQQAGIETTEIGYRALSKEIRTVGAVEVDERLMRHIVARTAGRVDRLFVNFMGQTVREGEPLVSIYSPALVSTEQEMVAALGALDRLRSSNADAEAVARQEGVVASARQRLVLWGLTEAQVEEIARSREAGTHIELLSPISGTVTHLNVIQGQNVEEGWEMYHVTDLSHVWIMAEVFEDEIAWIRTGQRIAFTTVAYPDETFAGEVTFIDPTMMEERRTVRVRMEAENPDGKLKPGMYVQVRIDVPLGLTGAAVTEPRTVYVCCPLCPEIVSDTPGTCPQCGMDLRPREIGPTNRVARGFRCEAHPDALQEAEGACATCGHALVPAEVVQTLAVPATAVVDTGDHRVVFVERESGTFEGLEVTLGPRAGEWFPVRSGLTAGDKVVVRGAFLLDAETRLNPAAGAYFGAQGGPSAGTHDH